MLIERERTTKHLRESEEEVERLKTEEIRVPHLLFLLVFFHSITYNKHMLFTECFLKVSIFFAVLSQKTLFPLATHLPIMFCCSSFSRTFNGHAPETFRKRSCFT